MLYTTATIAKECGVHERTARRVLSEFFPSHSTGTWWRLNANEHAYVKEQIRLAQIVMPKQPRRQLHRERPIIPFW